MRIASRSRCTAQRTRRAVRALSVVVAVAWAGPLAAQDRIHAASPTEGESPSHRDARLSWWREARFGMFIHWGPSSLTGKEISWSREATGPDVYDALYHRFTAENFDAKAWVAVARDAGMRYIVLTAKHHDGFMLWKTTTDAYHVGNSPFGRDVVAELAAAAREAGIPLGLYFSTGDWRDPDCRHPIHNPRFVERMHAQLTELLTGYGPIPLVWIDYDGNPCPSRPEETAALIRRLQPNVILNNRLAPLHPDESHGLVGPTGDYATPEQRVGSYCDTVPWETNMTIGTQWSWKPNDQIKPLQQCLETLVRTVGGDGNFLFNVGPRPDGVMEPEQVERLARMGDWLKQNGEAIYSTRGGPYAPTPSYASTRTADAVYIHGIRFTDDSLSLPPLPRAIRGASLLDGTPVEFTQASDRLAFHIDATRRDPNITVIKLIVDGSPLDLAPIHPPSSSLSLAYQRPAIVSSSIAPRFMHTPQAALDDNADTYWTPGRDEAIAATFAGRRFENVRLNPRDPLWIHSGWIAVELAERSRVGRAVLMEKRDPRSYEPVSSWRIEVEENGKWRQAAEGEHIGTRADVLFPSPVTSGRFRLVIEATGRPAIAEFQLFPPD